MKLNQRLLVHIGPIPTSGGTPTEVTVMEFSPNERFVKLRPANIWAIEYWVHVEDVKVFAVLGSRTELFGQFRQQYGPKHSTFQKEETRQSMADAVRLANAIFIRYTHSGFQHSTQETYSK